MLLNDDLDEDSIEIPVFVPLKELSSMLDVEPTGYYMPCPHCDRELRLHKKYLGHKVQCKFCSGAVTAQLSNATAFYTDCPHCQRELKNSMKYSGKKVACKHCEGHIQFVAET